MYFNASTGSTNGAVMCPVSGFAGMQTTNSSNLILQFVEAYETDTLDLTLTRVASSDPRIVMEAIVHAINFSKDSVINIADDFEKKYIESNITDITGLSDGFIFPILINRPTTFLVSESSAGKAADPGDGFSTTGYGHNTGSVGQINGEVLTTIFIDLGADAATNSGTAGKVIGKANPTADSYVTKITETKNGVVYGAELICVEACAGTGGFTTDIDVIATTDGLETGETASGDNLLVATNAIAKGDRVRSDDDQDGFGGMNDHYIYLVEGNSSGSAGTYTAGKFILRLYGAPTANLNDIS